MKKVMGLVIGLLPVSVSAQCITPPDCASIGYTETSCDGNSLKCPFDTSKLYCPPCDSSFKYSCSGENIKKPIGNACNNKYAACECIKGATYFNGECSCDIACETIGNIYYSDGSCSSCIDENKTAVGVVAQEDSIVLALNIPNLTFSPDFVDIPDLDNFSTAALAINDIDGQANTTKIANYYGSTIDSLTYGATFCYFYAPEGFETSQNRWYLPAAGEYMNNIYPNISTIIKTWARLGVSFSLYNGNIWTSTEWGGIRMAAISNYSGTIYHGDKTNPIYTICALKL